MPLSLIQQRTPRANLPVSPEHRNDPQNTLHTHSLISTIGIPILRLALSNSKRSQRHQISIPSPQAGSTMPISFQHFLQGDDLLRNLIEYKSEMSLPLWDN
ncbi:hypothetical protein BDZ45DRAFT_326320 [Acephala macrosclerotiorum]|nr:hypothetical protein BDZ45DRAFT_326320 [Acephala macrosclerotiorum]